MGDSTSSRGAIAPYNFHGTELEVVIDDQGVWTSISRVAGALGLDPTTQRAKLKHKPWARLRLGGDGLSPSPDLGGETGRLFIHLDSLPMWLATIEPRRVDPAIRPRLEVFQLECARALRDHFLPRERREQALPTLAAAPTPWRDEVEGAVRALIATSNQAMSSVDDTDGAELAANVSLTAWALLELLTDDTLEARTVAYILERIRAQVRSDQAHHRGPVSPAASRQAARS